MHLQMVHCNFSESCIILSSCMMAFGHKLGTVERQEIMYSPVISPALAATTASMSLNVSVVNPEIESTSTHCLWQHGRPQTTRYAHNYYLSFI